jgi:hypothetical protein
MTVSTTENRKSYAGNGVTVAFAFPYPFPANADLTVILVNGATGVETTKTLTTHYTVTGAGDAAGGTVTMVTAPAVGETLVILREIDLVQETDFVEGDALPVESIEGGLDRLVMISQQQQETIGRALKMPKSVPSTSFDPTLPSGMSGAVSKALITNSAGTGWAVGPSADEISNAQTYANNAATSLSNFKSQYLGAAATAPTTDTMQV